MHTRSEGFTYFEYTQSQSQSQAHISVSLSTLPWVHVIMHSCSLDEKFKKTTGPIQTYLIIADNFDQSRAQILNGGSVE